MVKILAIGNSFSQNATELLQLFNNELFVRNLYIGGCSLAMHCDNIKGNVKAYDYQENGAKLYPFQISIKDALLLEKWDYITVQQVSGYSGKIESYYPYIEELIKYVKKYSDAEIVLHQTWAYDNYSTHPHFKLYDSDRKVMYGQIAETTRKVAEKEKLRTIPVGEAIEKLRAVDLFVPENGGLSLTCDGFHLSENYGRFSAAAVWLKFFTGELPEFLNKENLSTPFKKIKEILIQMPD